MKHVPAVLLPIALVVMAASALLSADRDSSAEKARAKLRAGRPFEALLLLDTSFSNEPALVLALARLEACDWALAELATWQRRCGDDPASEHCPAFRKVEPEIVAACPRRPAAGTEPAADGAVLARLKAPRLVPFEERPVPVEQQWTGDRPSEPPSANAYPALTARAIAALSPGGPRLFAVSVSQDVDPRGEVSRGGYWVHLSADSGRTWRGPYYLGFAAQFPYVVVPASHVQPFEGDRFNLEVERREVDESTITFPPVMLRAKSVEKNLYLSIDVAAIERDSDGDGLTDLLEEKLALDPLLSDTDSDGLADAVDPLPLQARSEEEHSERGSLLAAVLPHLFGGPPPIQQSAASGAETSAMSPQHRPFASVRTLFVSGGDGLLPHDAGVRAVAFPPAALEEYRRKFGATYPMALPDIAFDRDGQRALIRYNFRWRGGSLLAVRKKGRWTIDSRRMSMWIT